MNKYKITFLMVLLIFISIISSDRNPHVAALARRTRNTNLVLEASNAHNPLLDVRHSAITLEAQASKILGEFELVLKNALSSLSNHDTSKNLTDSFVERNHSLLDILRRYDCGAETYRSKGCDCYALYIVTWMYLNHDLWTKLETLPAAGEVALFMRNKRQHPTLNLLHVHKKVDF